jgi:GPH family glycoside/pentoside/hexuronide:cation symporter
MSAVQFWLMPFYTDVALIAPALAGTALALTRVWDAVNDPLFGWVADKTTSRRFGRRRVYLIYGAIPFGLSIMPAGMRRMRVDPSHLHCLRHAFHGDFGSLLRADRGVDRRLR